MHHFLLAEIVMSSLHRGFRRTANVLRIIMRNHVAQSAQQCRRPARAVDIIPFHHANLEKSMKFMLMTGNAWKVGAVAARCDLAVARNVLVLVEARPNRLSAE